MRLITIAIIDDHSVFVESLVAAIATQSNLNVVGTAGTLDAARRLLMSKRPDVVLLDVTLTDGNGLDLLAESKRAYPESHFVVLTSSTEEQVLMRAIEYGACGYLTKHRALTEVISTVRSAATGDIVISRTELMGLLARIRNSNREGRDPIWPVSLSAREMEVLQLLAAGHGLHSIATSLSISPLTARTHIRNILNKLGVHSRLEAVVFAIRHDLIGVPN